MTDLYLNNILNEFDILFRNCFNDEVSFKPLSNSKFDYPIDVILKKNVLEIHIAALGHKKKDIDKLIIAKTVK